ncbi:PDDEXK nuclease domain-containing protein [Flavobacterium ajazii]|uniref:PDDEXK nuclease domain-containing protein n=1 Tax=Flavobacterium ajazii TaxID=2692318 RepID=UPI0013D85C4F|nr:PDDEXK nuclease domain-containing protein [Flavobacterium ajazii]
MSDEIIQSNDYKDWSVFILNKIKRAQTQTALKVNTEMLTLYWEIGNSIIEKQLQNGWGSKIIDLLANDLIHNFPDSKGFSVRNLKYMRAFSEAYPHFPIVEVPLAQSENEFVQVALAQITWYHHISLLTKVKDPSERAFYIAETAKNEWSRDVMLLQIQSNLYSRSGKALNNFKQTLPEYQSDLAKSIFKDPYHFDFLMLSAKVKELEIEKLLTQKITDFLLELGKGFAFIGRQYTIEIDNTDYKIDLLFYHTILHAYVVIELKAGEFMPEYISKLNFYISAIDDKLKTPTDERTIGLLLCASKSNIKVEYAMRGLDKPLGVATYQLEQLVKDNIDKMIQNEE